MKSEIAVDELMERVSGNKEFACKMLDTFFSSFNERMDKLKTNLAEQNYEELADNAHKMKGIVGNLSLHKPFELLKEMQYEAGHNNDKKIKKLLHRIEEAILKSRDFYESHPELFH